MTSVGIIPPPIGWQQRRASDDDDNDDEVALVDVSNQWPETASHPLKRYEDQQSAMFRPDVSRAPHDSDAYEDCLFHQRQADISVEENDAVGAIFCHELVIRKVWLEGHAVSKEIVAESIDGLRLLSGSLGSPLNISLSTSIVDCFRQIAELYWEMSDLDRTADTLYALLDFLLAHQSFDNQSLWSDLEQIGRVYEDDHLLDHALQCFEKTVLVKSHFYGERHVEVAKSLFDVSRVLDKQGNIEGGMDLYTVAHSMYIQCVARSSHIPQQLFQQGTLNFLVYELVPTLLDEGSYQQAVSCLNKCLEDPGQVEEKPQLDRSMIYLDLGRAYIGLEDFVSATVCLVEAAKEEGDVTEEEVREALDHIDFLQHHRPVRSKSFREENKSHTSADDDTVAALSEDESCSYGDGFLSDEATAYYDSGLEADREDLSQSAAVTISSDHFSEELPSLSDLPEIGIDPIPSEFKGDGEASDHVAEATPTASVTLSSPLSPTSDVQPNIPARPKAIKASDKQASSSDSSHFLRRKTNSFVEKFRRRRKGGFESLDDEIQDKDLPAYPEEDDYHSMVTFDGPVQYLEFRSGSFDSAVSQITWKHVDTENAAEPKQEWWWGVTSEGFARWFPTTYVSQAVEAAEGFLSAQVIHNQIKAAPLALNLLSSEYDESSDGSDKKNTSTESQNAVAKESSVANTSTNEKPPPPPSLPPPQQTPPPSNKEVVKHNPIPLKRSSRSRLSHSDLSAEVESCTKRLVRQRKELGEDHSDVAMTLFTLAVLHSRMKTVKPAVVAAREALRIQQATGDTDAAIQSLHFLADIHLHRQHYKSAISHYTKALKLESNKYGYISNEAAKTLNCIGAARSLQNDFTQAMESHQEALRILHLCHGEYPKTPLISDTLCQMGSVYYRERNNLSSIKEKPGNYSAFIESGMLEVIGRAHEDRGSYRMAMSFFDEKLHFLESRAAHEDNAGEVAETLNSLGMLSTRAGLYNEALDYYERALKQQMKLGCSGVELATARVLKGVVYSHLGQWKTSLKLLQDSLRLLQQELGQHHETVAATQYQIGVVYSTLLEENLATQAFNQALEGQIMLLGVNHPATLRTRREIGKLESSYTAGPASALETFNDVMREQQQIHGEKHPNIADTLHCMGCAYSNMKDFPNALRYLEEAYHMRLDFLGWDHPLQADTLHEISKIHLDRSRLKKASHICDAVLRIRRESLNEKHVDVARALATKGSCLVAKGDFNDAAHCFDKAQYIMESSLGERHPLSAELHIEAGLLFLRKCQFDEAREQLQRSLKIYKDSGIDDDHVCVRNVKEKLLRVERDEMLCV